MIRDLTPQLEAQKNPNRINTNKITPGPSQSNCQNLKIRRKS